MLDKLKSLVADEEAPRLQSMGESVANAAH